MSETHDFWTDRLSEFLDGDLPHREAQAVEEHLAGCPPCRKVRDELAEIRRRARALAALEPAQDLWPGIVGRLGEDPLEEKVIPLAGARRAELAVAREGRLRFSFPQAVAAAVVLLAGGWMAGAGLASRSGVGGIAEPGGALPGNPAVTAAATDALPSALSDEVAALERTLRDRAGALDPDTRATLLRSLEVIDRAIRESVEALSRDPGSEYLQEHLGSALARKRGYLIQMVQLLEA